MYGAGGAIKSDSDARLLVNRRHQSRIVPESAEHEFRDRRNQDLKLSNTGSALDVELGRYLAFKVSRANDSHNFSGVVACKLTGTFAYDVRDLWSGHKGKLKGNGLPNVDGSPAWIVVRDIRDFLGALAPELTNHVQHRFDFQGGQRG